MRTALATEVHRSDSTSKLISSPSRSLTPDLPETEDEAAWLGAEDAVPGFLSPKTKLGWLPQRSVTVAFSCLAFFAPFLWGAWPMWPVQCALSLLSDYVHTGQDSWWHVADRLLARSLSVFMICTSLVSLGLWCTVALIAGSFSFYGISVRAMWRQDYTTYVWAHTMWHLAAGASNSVIMASVCDASLSAAVQAARVALWLRQLQMFIVEAAWGGPSDELHL
eukprot:CAMPEP_0202773898 /NCGR_PEP_ID=MMETSP1388-20130828/45424_1 /ASSEMBLY_ACC=CAM_ASM_000864 /TAXON_ID=37098 /ORGANISM="Isochrysis sp, Strain CCMP1244" /LENGTH=221 /DNA_ID=CAMNT_0049442935 /DNA_START=105 /DNA_END=769 /DNA_ORIENTATION=-